MDNAERLQAIQQLGQRTDPEAIHTLIAAIDDPVTCRIALRTLNQLNTPQATDALYNRLVTDDRDEVQVFQFLKDLSSRIVDFSLQRLEQHYGAFPLQVILTVAQYATPSDYAAFECWRTAQAKPPLTVITVDDDPSGCVLLQVIVNQTGEMIMVASGRNGEEGIKLAERFQPTVIIVDHMMPSMDGLEAIPHIRRVAPHTKIIFRTYRFHDKAVVAQAKAVGADDSMDYGPLVHHEVVDLIRRVACA